MRGLTPWRGLTCNLKGGMTLGRGFNNGLIMAMLKMVVAYHMKQILDPREIAEITGIRIDIVEELYTSLTAEGGRD